MVLTLVAAVVVAGVLVTLDFVRRPDWATNCGVSGHANWCAQPSAAITDPSIVAVVHAYCPGFANAELSDVVPQPLLLLDLGDRGAFAKVSGHAEVGSEEALLGRSDSFSWVTRWVGGDRDGQWEVSCPGYARSTPRLHLEADQLDSTVAATQSAPGRHIDFGEVSRQMSTAAPGGSAAYLSFGYLQCDTASLDLARLPLGGTFSCDVEVYGQQGKGAYLAVYRIISQRPYFRPSTG